MSIFLAESVEQVVHRAQGIPSEHQIVTCAERCQENNRGVPRSLSVSNQRRRLKSIHTWHLDIEENHKILIEHISSFCT